MKRTRLSILAAAALGATACAQMASGGDHTDILGAWTVAEIDGAAIPDGVPVDATFSADGRVSGASGCNRYGGSYVYKRGVVTISETFMTEMACIEDGRMGLEAKFHNRFSGALSAAAAPDGSLILTDDEGGLVLRKRLLGL
jgi:putative lipoprotein